MVQQTSEKNCEECLGPLINTGKDIACQRCGLVQGPVYVSSRFVMGGQSANPISSARSTALGKHPLVVGGLGSEIDFSNSSIMRDSSGKYLSQEKQAQFHRLKSLYHNRTREKDNVTHLRTFMIFNKISSQLQIDRSIKERAAFKYWKIVKNPPKKITNHVALIALTLLLSVREYNQNAPIRFQEIIKAFNSAGHRVTNKNLIRMARDMNISLRPTHIRQSEEYLTRITSVLTGSPTVQQRLYENGLSLNEYNMSLQRISSLILENISRQERGGVQPYGFAVSAVYMADRVIGRGMRRKPVLTQEIVTSLTDSAEFTIRDHCRRIIKPKLLELSNLVNKEVERLAGPQHTYVVSRV